MVTSLLLGFSSLSPHFRHLFPNSTCLYDAEWFLMLTALQVVIKVIKIIKVVIKILLWW